MPPAFHYSDRGQPLEINMIESILLWLAETFAGAIWRYFFPPKTAESEERKEANEIQKPATGSYPSIVDKL